MTGGTAEGRAWQQEPAVQAPPQDADRPPHGMQVEEADAAAPRLRAQQARRQEPSHCPCPAGMIREVRHGNVDRPSGGGGSRTCHPPGRCHSRIEAAGPTVTPGAVEVQAPHLEAEASPTKPQARHRRQLQMRLRGDRSRCLHHSRPQARPLPSVGARTRPRCPAHLASAGAVAERITVHLQVHRILTHT